MKWQRIRFPILAELLHHKKERLRWKWLCEERNGRKHLLIVSPRGVRWDFKLNGGAWIRRANQPGKNDGDRT